MIYNHASTMLLSMISKFKQFIFFLFQVRQELFDIESMKLKTYRYHSSTFISLTQTNEAGGKGHGIFFKAPYHLVL